MPGREIYLAIKLVMDFLCSIYEFTESVLRGFLGLLDALGAFYQWFMNQVCGWLSNIPFFGGIFERICEITTNLVMELAQYPRDVIEWTFERILDLLATFIWVVVYAGMSATWLVHLVTSRWPWFLHFTYPGASNNWKKQCIKIRLVVVRTPSSPGISEMASALSDFESKTREILTQCGIPQDQVIFSRWEFLRPENADGVGFAANFFPIKDGVFSPRTFRWFMCMSSSIFEPTIFLVDKIWNPSRNGETIPVFTNYCLVEKNQLGEDGMSSQFVTLVHELGHLCDIWPHADSAERTMFHQPNDQESHVLTIRERSLIRSSRFVEFVH